MADYGILLCRRCNKPFNKTLTGPMQFCSDSCRFWNAVKIGAAEECWPWQLSKTPKGYGNFPSCCTDDGRSFHSAHRASYYFTYGTLPDELLILHRCDNRECCNPGHLYLGDCIDNNRDKRERFRAGKKLTVEMVRQIKTDKRPSKEVAIDFGVSTHNVYLIRKGKIWAAA